MTKRNTSKGYSWLVLRLEVLRLEVSPDDRCEQYCAGHVWYEQVLSLMTV